MLSEQKYLQQYDITQFNRPSLTTDMVLFTLDKSIKNIKQIAIHGLQVLLIKRGSHPYKDKWALPGGFCKPTETIYETARRELYEETGVSDINLKLIGTYSNLNRDPRGWIISNAFMGLTPKEHCNLRADTDAWDTDWFTFQEFTSHMSETQQSNCKIQTIEHRFALVSEKTNETYESVIQEVRMIYPTYTEASFSIVSSNFAFDHAQILCETYLQLRDTISHDIRSLFYLFPETFTIGELQKAYEIIMGTPVTNFRRTISPYVLETNQTADKAGYRPAKLYTKNLNAFS